MSTSSVSLLKPVGSSDRVELIDILRGFALLGILLVNFEGSEQGFLARVNSAVSVVLDPLVAGSFYPLFSFLFGLGFAVQLARAQEKGSAIVPLYFRRMLVLFLIGAVHAVLIWEGDILVSYALFGLLLIPLHKLSYRGLWVAIFVVLAFAIGSDRIDTAIEAVGVGDAIAAELEEGYAHEQSRSLRSEWMRAEEDGRFSAYLAYRWTDHGHNLARFADWRWIVGNDILMLFLLGLLVGRRGYLQRANEHRRGLAILAAAGFVIAVGGYFVKNDFSGVSSEIRVLGWMTSNYGATTFYVAVISLLVVAGGRAARALRVFSDVGRMALTNYLMQSVVMTLLLYSYGFGLHDELGTTVRLVLHLIFFFLVQAPLSRWWLKRYRFGPAEWLWRSLTYGEMQPMRRAGAVVAATPKLEAA